jgi:hypothetical protein
MADLVDSARPGRNRARGSAIEASKGKECTMCSAKFHHMEVLSCADDHHTCFGCVVTWVSSACEPDGLYFRECSTTRGVCRPGETPCPLFLSGDCRVSCLPEEDIMRALLADPRNPQPFRDYMRATRILSEMKVFTERQQHQAREAAAAAAAAAESDPVQRAHDAIINALTEAMIRRCPACHATGGIKDEYCIHIGCPCGTTWCYTCECIVGKCLEQWPSALLHRNGGWGDFAQGSETPEEGAVYEFLRRVAACRIREIKMSLDSAVWEQLKTRHPTLLENIIHGSRRISWEETDTAVWPRPEPRPEPRPRYRWRPIIIEGQLDALPRVPSPAQNVVEGPSLGFDDGLEDSSLNALD